MPPLNDGDVLGGDFVIEKLVGVGGMGAVYRAKQLSTDKARAIKVLLPEYARDDEYRARFQREARASRAIHVSNVVDVVASGIHEGHDLQWIAMEWLEGETLDSFVKSRGPVPLLLRVEILTQLFFGMAAVHEAGLVHRDLKPPNIHVCPPVSAGATVNVKVLDFGIAKDTLAEAAVTAPFGSGIWMAPEQGRKGTVAAPMADVWALGLLVYWLLTGEVPERGTGGEPRPPEREEAIQTGVALGEHGLGSEMDEWLSRCLARDPGQRFRDARESWQALSPLLFALTTSSSQAPGPVRVPAESGADTRPDPEDALVPSHTSSPMTRGLTPARRGWVVFTLFVSGVLTLRACGPAATTSAAPAPSPASAGSR